MKNVIKNMLFVILIVSLIMNIVIVPTVSAVSWGQIQQQAKDFLTSGNSGQTLDVGTLQGTIIDVGQILTTIGLAVVMVGLVIIGIKYMMASPEEAAKLKGQLVGLVVSAIVIFGAWSIWNITIRFFASMGV